MSDTYSIIPPPRLRARCETCLDDGWIEVTDCNCGAGWIGGDHESWCGVIECPEGCADEPP